MEAISTAISAVHKKILTAQRRAALALGLAKQPAFTERHAVIKSKGGANFWAKVLRGHDDVKTQLMGPYDDRIFDAIEDFVVTYKEKGVRIEMHLRPNEYISDSVLWYDEEEDVEERPNDFVPTTSGVTWKAGKGPREDESDDDQQQAGGGAATSAFGAVPPSAGTRRARDDETDERGPSFFSFFESVPEAPSRDKLKTLMPFLFNKKDDSASKGAAATKAGGGAAAASSNNNNDDDNDDDDDDFDDEAGGDQGEQVLDAMTDQWEDMLSERLEIARCLIEEIWEEPLTYLQRS